MENSAFGVRARFCASTLPTSGLAGGSTEEPFGEVWRISAQSQDPLPQGMGAGGEPKTLHVGVGEASSTALSLAEGALPGSVPSPVSAEGLQRPIRSCRAELPSL